MKTARFLSLSFPLILLCSCAHYDFNPEVRLDGGENQTVAALECGTGSLELSYTVAESDDMGVFEIENQGSCAIEGQTSLESDGTNVRLPDQIRRFSVPVRAPARVNTFRIAADAGSVLKIKIDCGESQGESGCRFYYRFSSAKDIGNKKPAIPSITLNDTPPVSVPGPTTPAGANQCITPPGGELVLKEIVNKSREDLWITFKAFNDCRCFNFIVYGEPEDRRRNRRAVSSGPAAEGAAFVPAGATVRLKGKCDTGSLTTEVCRGHVFEYVFSTLNNQR